MGLYDLCSEKLGGGQNNWTIIIFNYVVREIIDRLYICHLSLKKSDNCIMGHIDTYTLYVYLFSPSGLTNSLNFEDFITHIYNVTCKIRSPITFLSCVMKNHCLWCISDNVRHKPDCECTRRG